MENSSCKNGGEVVRLGTISHLPLILEELGADARVVVNSVGLSLSDFGDPEFKIPYVKLGKLLGHCAQSTGCGYFGLLVGQKIFLHSLGLLGFLMQSANTVRDAIEDYLSFADLQDQGAVTLINSINGVSLLSYSIFVEDVEAEEHIYDGTMAGYQNVLRSLCGENFKPTEILFTRSRPKDSKPYDRFFKAPIRYNSEYNAIAFHSNCLELAPVRIDPHLNAFIKKEVKKQHAAQPKSITETIHPLLRRLLIAQKCTLSETAAQLGLHSRTLNRRLKAEGTTFQAEAEAARYLMARQFLLSSNQSIAEVAIILGYSDTSAFTNAFKRWSGTSPSEWRKQKTMAVESSLRERSQGDTSS